MVNSKSRQNKRTSEEYLKEMEIWFAMMDDLTEKRQLYKGTLVNQKRLPPKSSSILIDMSARVIYFWLLISSFS